MPPPQGFDVTIITGDTHADDLEAIRGAAGLERAAVVGDSIAGPIGSFVARVNPRARQSFRITHRRPCVVPKGL